MNIMKNISEGITFDIHRFSLNDGPGIRTTVFLKGCPMKCLWCHNPESQSFKPQLSFNPDKCINCFNCVEACSNGVHKIINDRREVEFNLCSLNGDCVSACTTGALKIIGNSSSVDSIMNEVLKDRLYYEKSGGGITISGGEPLAQPQFTKAILTEAKKAGIHTCVDTCGFAKQKVFEDILELTDIFLFDYKATNPEMHFKLTGVEIKPVLDNLDFLYRNNASIILRCPLIPGVNDTEEHLNGIKNLLTKYPKIHSAELMPYHDMGRDKAAQVGMIYRLRDIKSANKHDKERWLSYFPSTNRIICT